MRNSLFSLTVPEVTSMSKSEGVEASALPSSTRFSSVDMIAKVLSEMSEGVTTRTHSANAYYKCRTHSTALEMMQERGGRRSGTGAVMTAPIQWGRTSSRSYTGCYWPDGKLPCSTLIDKSIPARQDAEEAGCSMGSYGAWVFVQSWGGMSCSLSNPFR